MATTTQTDLETAWHAFACACAAFSLECDVELERDQEGARVSVYLSEDAYTLDLELLADVFAVEQMPTFCDAPFVLWHDGQDLPAGHSADPYVSAGNIFREIAEREPHAELRATRGSVTKELRVEMELRAEPFTFDLPAMRDLLRRHGLPTSLEFDGDSGLVISRQPR